ncbi:hypothetical protein [Luteibacter aegosomatissinici]|uniref:hypothetical protein n=1 Tax=Luteibacter aegosomatissinici TaxID=2911539 RepID=UPI001FFAB90F|nr:hypothetical protein [Luteibacter aegosomatissinici]UPG92814.1 hypothetical protein L2Y97_13160 [Luteibacter aegosomatissinici]
MIPDFALPVGGGGAHVHCIEVFVDHDVDVSGFRPERSVDGFGQAEVHDTRDVLEEIELEMVTGRHGWHSLGIHHPGAPWPFVKRAAVTCAKDCHKPLTVLDITEKITGAAFGDRRRDADVPDATDSCCRSRPSRGVYLSVPPIAFRRAGRPDIPAICLPILAALDRTTRTRCCLRESAFANHRNATEIRPSSLLWNS